MVLLPPTTLVTEVIVRSIRAANLDARSEDRRIEGSKVTSICESGSSSVNCEVRHDWTIR